MPEGDRDTKPDTPPTQEQVDKYIRGGGIQCPFCGSDDIEGTQFDAQNGSVWQEVSCNVCERYWTDVYTIDNLEVNHNVFSPTPEPDPRPPHSPRNKKEDTR